MILSLEVEPSDVVTPIMFQAELVEHARAVRKTIGTTSFGEDEFHGTLLQPPTQGFGLEAGQKVRYRAYKNEGEIVLILDSSMLS